MAKTQRDLGKEIAIDAAKGITKKHSKFWNAMDEGRRAVFNARASELQDQKREQLRDRVGDTRVELDILRRRGQEVARQAPPCRISSCRIGEQGRALFDELYEKSTWSEAELEDLRNQAMVPIGQPSLAEQQVLEAMEIWDSRSHHGRQPHWLMWFAFNRDELSSSILRYDYNDGTSRFYRFVLATQNPLLVVVEVARLAVDCLSDIEWLDLPTEAHAWDHHLVRSVGQMLYSAIGALDDTRANVFLLMHSSCRNGFHVCGDGEFVPIEALLVILALA